MVVVKVTVLQLSVTVSLFFNANQPPNPFPRQVVSFETCSVHSASPWSCLLCINKHLCYKLRHISGPHYPNSPNGDSTDFMRSTAKRRKLQGSQLLKSYFDTLCNEEINRIALWMSEQPTPRQWFESVRYRDLNKLMSVSSRLHGIVQEMLPKDVHQSKYRVPCDSIDSTMPVLSRTIEWYEIQSERDVHVLGLMPHLTGLKLDMVVDSDDTWGTFMSNIRVLPLRSLILHWIESTAVLYFSTAQVYGS